MKLEKIKLSKLKSNTGQIEGLPANPRLIKDSKYQKLVKSLQDDPEMLELRELVAYDNNGELIVIMGNMRYKALTELGIKETFVKVLPNNTPVEKLKAYTIKDNVSFGENDFDMLANEWDEIELEDWGVDLPNFTETENKKEKQELKPFLKSHCLISYHPDNHFIIQDLLNKIIDNPDFEIEMGSN